MEGTNNFHDSIPGTKQMQPTDVLDNAAAFDTTDDMLNAHTKGSELAIEGFLVVGEGAAFWLFEGEQGFDTSQGKAQKAQILQQPTVWGQRIGVGIGHPLVMDMTVKGVTQKANEQSLIDQEQIFTV
jgi:hypothetical protein